MTDTHRQTVAEATGEKETPMARLERERDRALERLDKVRRGYLDARALLRDTERVLLEADRNIPHGYDCKAGIYGDHVRPCTCSGVKSQVRHAISRIRGGGNEQ